MIESLVLSILTFLQLDDVVDFINEVEDGWWKGKLKGRVGVFPSNFVEMITAADEKNVNVVADKNKKNERLKGTTSLFLTILNDAIPFVHFRKTDQRVQAIEQNLQPHPGGRVQGSQEGLDGESQPLAARVAVGR